MSVPRIADPVLQENVDEMILDYLTFTATEALLFQLRGSLHKLQRLMPDLNTDHRIDLADGFNSIYESLHVSPASSGTQFRIRLLQFVKNLKRWHSLVSNTLDSDQAKGGNLFSSGDSGFPNSRDHKAQKFVERRYRKSKASLLETLPSFMALSASQLALQGGDAQITEIWMHLAGDFMLHAAFEYANVFKSEQSKVRDKAFHWGFDWNITAREGSDDFMINAMFFDSETEATNETWIEIRKQYEVKLKPPSGTTFHDYARSQCSTTLLSPDFEERLLVFLENLHNGLSLPILLQVELAQIEGLNQAQANRLREIISNTARINE